MYLIADEHRRVLEHSKVERLDVIAMSAARGGRFEAAPTAGVAADVGEIGHPVVGETAEVDNQATVTAADIPPGDGHSNDPKERH